MFYKYMLIYFAFIILDIRKDKMIRKKRDRQTETEKETDRETDRGVEGRETIIRK